MITSAKDVFNQAKKILKAGGIETYAFDAACLFEFYFGINPKNLIVCDSEIADPSPIFDGCERYLSGEPLQYIIGEWEFYGLPFYVNPDVLIPRADTETLIDYALSVLPQNAKVIDMCCGSGCIGITLKKLRPDIDVTLADISEKALAVSKKNAERNGVTVSFIKTDLFDGPQGVFEDGAYDMLISNPPYISKADMQTLSKWVKAEPSLALYGGEDGTDCYFALINGWKSVLKVGGELVLETGYDTKDAVLSMLTELEYTEVTSKKDLHGIVRIACGKRGNYEI